MEIVTVTSTKDLPDKDVLEELFHYDELTGQLYYRYRDRKWFKTNNAFAVFNSRTAGKTVGSKRGASRYSKCTLFNNTHLTHRLIYKLVTGESPEEVDHIDGDTFNNKIENLRPSNKKLNKLNQKVPKHNTTGFVGVTKQTNGKWRASYMLERKTFSVGTFKDYEEACKAALEARLNAGFYKEHGDRK